MSEHLSDAEELIDAEAETWDDWQDDESGLVKSLFSDDTFSSVDEALACDSTKHAFDLRQLVKQTKATLYDTLKLINFIRSEVSSGKDPRLQISESLVVASLGSGPWQNDKYLHPVLDNDELLLYDWDEPAEDRHESQTQIASIDEDADLSALIHEMRALASEEEGLRDLLAASSRATCQSQTSLSPTDVAGAATAPTETPTQSTNALDHRQIMQEAERIDANYFESYSFLDIHREMLADAVRMEAYRRALEENPSLMQGATVLDVGCGTGILSMFAVRGGAAKVVAVDGSSRIAGFAADICARNGFGGGEEGPITVLSSRIETLSDLPVPDTPDGTKKVDVLVSEWMGYALLFESMLSAVLLARDRFLRPGGAILPDVARIFVAGAGEGASGIDFWKDVHGIRMDPVADVLRQTALRQGIVRGVTSDHLITPGVLLHTLDLSTMDEEDQDFTAEFNLGLSTPPIQEDARTGPSAGHGSSSVRECHALVLWFDTLFTERFCKDSPQELTTAPHAAPTHWAQTALLLPTPVTLGPPVDPGDSPGVMEKGAAIALRGRVSMARRAGRHRTLDISVEYAAIGADGQPGESKVQLYTMGVSS